MNNRFSKLSKPQRTLAKSAVYFFLDKMCPRLKNKLYIRVIGDKLLTERENIHADCDFLDTDSRYPREFKIRICTDTQIDLFLISLMHELIHVKQFARGELIYKGPVYKWKGKMVDPERVEYWDQPWEIEAHGREKGLVCQFLTKDEKMYDLYMEVKSAEVDSD